MDEVLPTEGPRISGGQPKYNVGDEVAINCTSAKSKPAATLRWFINDNLIEPGEFDTEYSTTLHEDGLETSSLSLSFVAKDKHFIDGTMRLKCTASISRMYTMSNEEMFLGGRQQSSTLQVPENESKEKPIKEAANTKRKGQAQGQGQNQGPKQMQTAASNSGSLIAVCQLFLILPVTILLLRVT